MCIVVDERVEAKESGFGYKVFRRQWEETPEKFELVGEYCGLHKSRPIGKWLKAEDYEPDEQEQAVPVYEPIQFYTPGFHIFLNRKDADSWRMIGGSELRMRRVKYRGLIAKGDKDTRACVVAKEIFIIPLKGDRL